MTGFRKSILPAATWPLGEMKLDEVRRPGVEEPLLVSPWFLNGDALYAAMKPTTVLQMIAAVDIGKYGALAFTDARLKNRELDIAGVR